MSSTSSNCGATEKQPPPLCMLLKVCTIVWTKEYTRPQLHYRQKRNMQAVRHGCLKRVVSKGENIRAEGGEAKTVAGSKHLPPRASCPKRSSGTTASNTANAITASLPPMIQEP